MRRLMQPRWLFFLLFLVALPSLYFLWHKDQETPCALQTSSPQESPYDLTIVGYILPSDGLGHLPLDLINCLEGNTKISFIHTRPMEPKDESSLDQRCQEIVHTNGASHEGRVVIFEEQLTQPWTYQHVDTASFWDKWGLQRQSSKELRLAYSMYETDRISKDWVEILNNSFDAVFVPDESLVLVYKESGVLIPIFHLPLSFKLDDLLEAPLKNRKGNPMTFAAFGSCTWRKNHKTLIMAFDELFHDNNDVQLKLSWRYFTPQVRAEIFRLISERGCKNIIIDETPADRSLYVHRFSDIDCYVSASLGEGFSKQPREAMALGIPVIVTDNTAQHTICATGLVRTVPARIKIPAERIGLGPCGHCFGCSVKDLSEAMNDVYLNYDKYLQNGKKSREWVRQYEYDRLASLYRTLVKPKRVLLGSKNEIQPGIIVTNDKRFFNKASRVLLGRRDKQ